MLVKTLIAIWFMFAALASSRRVPLALIWIALGIACAITIPLITAIVFGEHRKEPVPPTARVHTRGSR